MNEQLSDFERKELYKLRYSCAKQVIKDHGEECLCSECQIADKHIREYYEKVVNQTK